MREKIIAELNQHKTIGEILPIVKNIFNLILDNGEWTNEFFLHPLGFYYCRLLTNAENQVRIHIWEPDYPKKLDLFIHDHFYELCSWVLCGKILDYSYSVEPAEGESEHTMFVSSYQKDKNVRTLTKTNDFRVVKRIAERIIQKGQKYIIPKGTFHSNEILFEEADLTVTFVFTYDHNANQSPNVIGLSKNDVYYETDPINIPANKVKNLISSAVKNIGI